MFLFNSQMRIFDSTFFDCCAHLSNAEITGKRPVLYPRKYYLERASYNSPGKEFHINLIVSAIEKVSAEEKVNFKQH